MANKEADFDPVCTIYVNVANLEELPALLNKEAVVTQEFSLLAPIIPIPKDSEVLSMEFGTIPTKKGTPNPCSSRNPTRERSAALRRPEVYVWKRPDWLELHRDDAAQPIPTYLSGSDWISYTNIGSAS